MAEPPNRQICLKSSTTSSISIKNLPREVLWIIFSYMDQNTAQSSAASCKLWFEMIRVNSDLSSHICLKPIELHELDERLRDLQFIWARWPVLKTVHFSGYYPIYGLPINATEKIAKYSLRLVDSRDCPTLEKITISASYSLTRFSLELIGNSTSNLKDIYIRFINPIKDMNIHYFQTYICQLLFRFTNSLQRVQIQVLELYYINALFPDLKDITDLYVVKTTSFVNLIKFDLRKMCWQFKNLKRFHINVSLGIKSETDNYWVDDYWVKNEFSEDVDTIFQDITDVKIQCYRDTGGIIFTIAKKPNQKTEILTY